VTQVWSRYQTRRGVANCLSGSEYGDRTERGRLSAETAGGQPRNCKDQPYRRSGVSRPASGRLLCVER